MRTLILLIFIWTVHPFTFPQVDSTSSLLQQHVELTDTLNITTTCGGARMGEEYGQIDYKIHEEVLPNERCVWVISYPNTTRYEVSVYHLGSDPGGKHVSVAGLTRGTSNITYFFPTGSYSSKYISANTLVVTFSSGEVTRNVHGFMLHFYSSLTIDDSFPLADPGSVGRVVEPDTIHVRHPPVPGGAYLNSELSVFAFAPARNTFDEGRKGNIIYMNHGLDSCQDLILVYVFNSGTKEWDMKGRICGPDMVSGVIAENDLILLVFHTDDETVSDGFSLMYSIC